jgi:thioredoxin-related protein
VKTFRSILLALTAVLAFSATACADAKPGWLTDIKQAKEQAQNGKKLILVDFTGSDWCGWCIKLDREVFSKPEFKEYADKNLVLLEVDFPKRKELSAAQKAHNLELAERYGIQGFPTIIVLNGEGKKLGELGYMPGGPSAFLAELDKLRKG